MFMFLALNVEKGYCQSSSSSSFFPLGTSLALGRYCWSWKSLFQQLQNSCLGHHFSLCLETINTKNSLNSTPDFVRRPVVKQYLFL